MKSLLNWRIIFLLMLGCLAGQLQAQPLAVNGQTHRSSLAGYLFASPAQMQKNGPNSAPVVSAQEALALYRSGGFEKLPGYLGRGFKADAVWVAFDLQALPNAPQTLIVEVGPAVLDRITAYQTDALGHLVELGQSGDQVPKAQVTLLAINPSFSVILAPLATTTVLLQIKTTSSQAAVVNIYPANDFPFAQTTLGLVLGALFSSAVIMMMMALGFYVVFKERGYLTWLVYLLFGTSHWFMIDGLGYLYFDWVDLRLVNAISSLLSIFSLSFAALLFSSLFQFALLNRWLHRGFLATSVLFVVVGGVGVMLGYPLIVALVSLITFPVMAVTVVAVLLQMLRGHTVSLLHGPLLLLYLGCVLTYMLSTLGWFPFSDMLFYGWQVAGFLNLLSLQLAMFLRARQLLRHHAQERAHLLLQLTDQNQVLEEQVTARTQSLATALRSVQQAESEQRKLLSMASHEFRTPAAVIKASLDSLDYLQEHITPEVQTRLVNMRQASLRMIALSNNLIDQDRLIELSLKPQLLSVDMVQLVTGVLTRYPESCHIQARLPVMAPVIQGDAALLSIALHNLIDNALRHGQSPQGLSLPVTVSLSLQPGQLVLEVADSGVGIADDQKTKVFERFHTIQNSRRATDSAPEDAPPPTTGSGLGLAIVQSIAQAHGGRAWVRDNLPHGAVLALCLPMPI